MKTKKLVSLIMAGAMTLALAIPAFAAAEPGQEITIAAQLEGASINVEIDEPAEGSLILNPYSIAVEGQTGDPKQLYFTPAKISSTSNVALEVNAKVTGEVSTGVKFATADFKTQPTDKQVFLFMAVGSDSSALGELTTADYNAKATEQLLVGAKQVSKTAMDTLAVGAGGTAAETYYTFVGSLSKAPATAWDGENDTVGVKVIFDFKAVEAPEE